MGDGEVLVMAQRDVLPCGCTKTMVAAFGHYSYCALSVTALLAIVDDGAKTEMKGPWNYGVPKPKNVCSEHPDTLPQEAGVKRMWMVGVGWWEWGWMVVVGLVTLAVGWVLMAKARDW